MCEPNRNESRDNNARLRTVLVVGMLVGVAGCAVTGTWKRMPSSPSEASLPVTHVTFGEQARFTATLDESGTRRTCTGTYRAGGLGMRLTFEGDEQISATARLRPDGTLVLTRTDGDRASAMFERIKE